MKNRTQLVLGILLLLVAAWLVAVRINPDLGELINLKFDWPMWIILVGAGLLLLGLLVGEPGMAVPACIVAGIGGILYYQNETSAWDSWSYMWALIPGFVGIGSILSGILGKNFKESARHGLNLVVTSLILFLVFAAIFGGLNILGNYKDWTLAGILLILGIWFIIRGILRSK